MDNQVSLENKGNSKTQIENCNLLLEVNFYIKIELGNIIYKNR